MKGLTRTALLPVALLVTTTAGADFVHTSEADFATKSLFHA